MGNAFIAIIVFRSASAASTKGGSNKHYIVSTNTFSSSVDLASAFRA